ncbi:MAG: pyridoxal 5'-phosphate synthase glutaminase subunit PdxT [Syntrophaceae bacterium]|nr:pyridoxal 5'-phosphate synthase glutaminase subunit PdxT [Syntrophaceae bacterium]
MNSQKKKKTGVIGILDLQGGVCEHLDHLQRLGIVSRKVKQSSDFHNLAGLIIPGGESSCMSRLINIFKIREPLLNAYARGMKIWGTCAGAILLAKQVVGEDSCLGLIDIEIERNSFGSQLDSFKIEALVPQVAEEPVPLTFIRAPKILKTGKEVNVLLKIDDYIVAAESKNILVTVFHPELTGSLAFHQYFAVKCGLNPSVKTKGHIDEQWNNCSWTRLAHSA